MRKTCLTLLVMITSFAAFGSDQISVTINGQSYVCSGAGAAASPHVVSVYCECKESAGISLQRIAIMSDGTAKVVASTSLTPSNGSYNPAEVREKCRVMVKECNR